MGGARQHRMNEGKLGGTSVATKKMRPALVIGGDSGRDSRAERCNRKLDRHVRTGAITFLPMSILSICPGTVDAHFGNDAAPAPEAASLVAHFLSSKHRTTRSAKPQTKMARRFLL
jgi:hypothetical protein